MNTDDLKDKHPRSSSHTAAVDRKRKKVSPGKPRSRTVGPQGEVRDQFPGQSPGQSRKFSKKDAGFEPDSDVEAGHEDDERPGSGEP